MSAPLTNVQKRTLAQLARRASGLLAAKARGRGEEWILTDEEFRHQEVIKAVSKAGLRCCTQNDYSAVKAHFLELLGQHGAAFNAQVRAATEERRTIEYKIVQSCKEFGFHLSYADKICRAQNHGAGLDEVDGKKLWNIFFTIRNRGRKRESMRNAGTQEKEHAHA
jgi:hypothetical protein